MEETTTPVEAVVEDTSVAQEPETVETVADTSEQVTEPEQTTTEETAEVETEAVEQAAEEKLYAGKYKSIEDLEKGYKEAEKSFNKVAELEKKLQEYEQQKPQYVNEAGKINPQIKAQYEMDIDNREFLTYADLARSLDNEARGEVERLLSEAQRVYNPTNKQAYLNKLAEAKNYFNSDIVENIARSKMDLQSKMNSEIASKEQEALQQKANYFTQEIQKEPELYALVNPDSENHSPEIFGIVKSMFDAYQKIDVPMTMKAIEKIKELGVKQYLAKQEFEAKKEQANVKTGDSVSKIPSDLPSAKDVTNNYQKYIDKYMKEGLSFDDAMAKVDGIIMKG